jgi:membrane protease subunit HflK
LNRTLTVLLAVAALGWSATGVLFVAAEEVAVVFRFGAVIRTEKAGLRLRLPWPIESDERVAVTASRRAEPEPRRLITGDTNLVDLALAVEYVIADPVAYLTGLSDAAQAVSDQAMAAASELVATLEVDFLLTTGRATLEQGIKEHTQIRLDALNAGLRIRSVEVRELAPPPAVVDAFNDVSSARGDQETLALSADAYQSQVVPDARGQAARIHEESLARASVRTNQAQADISRFNALQAVYADSPEATRLALQHQALTEIGSRVEVVVAHAGTQFVLSAPAPVETP